MLSIEDIYKEVGKNIFICPLNTDNFRDNSVDLTASQFAWTPDGKYLYDEKTKQITIPANETACILTKEAIYVKSNIGGTYHSRVSLAKKGLGHIGTMLDPQYCGQSLIILHNHAKSDVIIKEDERIVSVVFYYISTPILHAVLATPPSHSNKVSTMDKEGRYAEWCSKNQWANNSEKLMNHFKEEYLNGFQEKKKLYAQKKNIFERIQSTSIGAIVLKYIAIVVLFVLAFTVIHFVFKENNFSWGQAIITVTVFVAGLIVSDIVSAGKK